jgi:CLIP-associating protein 1/2
MSNRGNGKPAEEKQEALQQLILLSRANDSSTWSQYFNQILTVVLESLDDPNSSIRELSLSLSFLRCLAIRELVVMKPQNCC